MSAAAAWWRTAREIERLVQSDDERGAVLARRDMERAINRAPEAAACLDPDLFAVMLEAATRWSRRIDPVERARWSSPLMTLAAAVMRLPSEAVHLQKAAAARRADPKMIAAEGGL